MTDSSRVVTVEIQGQRYPVRSALEPAYVAELASYVDRKMRTAADETPTGDSVKIAILAALNIADEYFRCRDAGRFTRDEMHRRTAEIEQLVDEAMARLR